MQNIESIKLFFRQGSHLSALFFVLAFLDPLCTAVDTSTHTCKPHSIHTYSQTISAQNRRALVGLQLYILENFYRTRHGNRSGCSLRLKHLNRNWHEIYMRVGVLHIEVFCSQATLYPIHVAGHRCFHQSQGPARAAQWSQDCKPLMEAIIWHYFCCLASLSSGMNGRVSRASISDILDGFFRWCFRASLRRVSNRSVSISDPSNPNFFRSFEQTIDASFFVKHLPWALYAQPPKILLIHFLRRVPCGNKRFVESILLSSLRSSLAMLRTTHWAVCNLFSICIRRRLPATMMRYKEKCPFVKIAMSVIKLSLVYGS